MKIVTVGQSQQWYNKSLATPYLTAFIRISPSLARKICHVRDLLKATDARQIYSPSSYLHVTVKEFGYLGEAVKQDDLPAILSVVRDVASKHMPFDLSVDGIGVFPSVIYGKVGKGTAEIRQMNVELVERLGNKVLQRPYDGKDMTPHVTIAHFTTTDVGPLLEEARKLAARSVGEMKVQEIQVKKSYPHRLFEKPRKRLRINEPLASFKREPR
jgi:RNA 2',3'-cyclic 3'-phosphodiesterase